LVLLRLSIWSLLVAAAAVLLLVLVAVVAVQVVTEPIQVSRLAQRQQSR
jgi:uncharacterized membrane protein YcjF (UPF0283 family)